MDTPDRAPPPAAPPPPDADATFSVKHVEAKASLLLLALLLMVLGAVAYLAYARGAFEPTQQLVLISDDSEGVVVGMDLTFAGFAIGRVKRIELAPDGNARILVDVPLKRRTLAARNRASSRWCAAWSATPTSAPTAVC